MSSSQTGELLDNVASSRFEMRIGGATAFVIYRRSGETIQLLHAEVPAELEGRGIGSELVRKTLEHVRNEGIKAVPRCSFIRAYVAGHPEFNDVMA